MTKLKAEQKIINLKSYIDDEQNHYLVSNSLKADCFDTILGSMIAISDDEGLYLLEFIDRQNLKERIKKLQLITKSIITLSNNHIISSIKSELELYFSGKIRQFETPLHLLGSPFQKLALEELIRIPYGVTRTYKEQSSAIGRSTAYRAVANANGNNRLAIIIPCHRIINSNGNLGGYSSGIARKKFLIEHEQNWLNKHLEE